jgi:hypothetical protein
MPETALLGLPLLVPEQAQKHATHNEALTALDAIVQLAVIDRDLAAPPGDPEEGDRYIVAAEPSSAWTGHAGAIAAWQGGAWAFHTPGIGWCAWVADEAALVIHDGAGWLGLGAILSELQNLARLGLGTTADEINPFAAKLNNALWTALYESEDGDGSLRFKFNKEAAGDVASMLFQTDFSGRAEIGLVGDDDLVFKVSPDGDSWVEALRVDNAEGTALFAGVALAETDTEPEASAGAVRLYLDANDNGLKAKFGDGTVRSLSDPSLDAMAFG